MSVLAVTNTTGLLRRVLWYLFLQLLVILCHVISITDADLSDNLSEGPILSPSMPLAASAIPDLPLPANPPLLHKPWKKHFSPHGAPTFVVAPAQPPSYGPLITSGHPSMKKNALVPPIVGLVEVDPTQPPLSPIVSDCCKLDMVLKPGSHGCHCVYPIKLELLLLSVSQNPNWNLFLQELASQLGLRVSQIGLINFYVLSSSRLNISMDITPLTGISFSASDASAINSSLALHSLYFDSTLVGDYKLLNLTWFQPPAPSPAPDNAIVIVNPDGEMKGHNLKMRRKIIITTGVASGSAGILSICIILYFRRQASSITPPIFLKKKHNQELEAFIRNHGPLAPKRYNFADVKKMTNFFKDKLGQGGYGIVYKGKLMNGHLVAVKVMKASKGNGEEFINEVASISRTSHVNIVSLLGFCFEGEKRVLVFDFMPNGSLEKFINHENSLQASQQLGWEKLYQIAVGVARGLEYLHRGCNTRIVHFDIKPHNILLDADFCPKISDFGLAKPCARKESIVSLLEARGTIGYIAPEVFSRNFGQVSYKSDVYSYGMMVLEMVGGRKNHEDEISSRSEEYFPQWIYKRLELDNEFELNGVASEEETEIVRKITIVGLWCIQTNPSDRPSMSKVIEMLEGPTGALKIPPRPFRSSPARVLSYSSTT